MVQPGSTAQSEAAKAAIAAMQAKLPKAEITKRVDHTHDLFSLWFTPPVNNYQWKSGQYCTIGIDGIERAYSIVSAAWEGTVELFIELVPNGELTPRLHKLKVGDMVSFRPSAKGLFVFNPKVTNHLMMSTVTGVVPFVSIARDYVHKNLSGHKFYIIEGASYTDEFVYDKELEDFAKKHPETFIFIPTISRPTDPKNAHWKGEVGRANAVMEKYIQKYNLPKDSTQVYACGHPGMIESCKEQSAHLGYKFVEEKFWVEP